MAVDPVITTTTTTVVTFGTVMSFHYFGVTVEQFLLGTVVGIIGATARTFFNIQTILESGSSINKAKMFGALGAAYFTTPFLSILYFALAGLMNFESEITVGILLLVSTYGGPSMVSKFVDKITEFLTARIAPPKSDKP